MTAGFLSLKCIKVLNDQQVAAETNKRLQILLSLLLLKTHPANRSAAASTSSVTSCTVQRYYYSICIIITVSCSSKTCDFSLVPSVEEKLDGFLRSVSSGNEPTAFSPPGSLSAKSHIEVALMTLLDTLQQLLA